MRDVSGEQIELVHGDFAATVTDVGAGLRQFRAQGHDIVFGFEANEICPDGRGQVLAPWPNRLEDGEYTFEGRPGVAPINETSTNNAIHGLTRWLNWTIEDHDSRSVALSCRIAAQPAYPFEVIVSVSYLLTEAGIEVVVRAHNVSPWTAPFGIGFHPYLLAGPSGVDGARLHIPAKRHLVVDQRQLPVTSQAIEQSPFSAFAESTHDGGAPLHGVMMDDCFSDLTGEPEEPWRAEFLPDDQSGPVELWADGSFGYLMCFTGDSLSPAARRRALALEPMTCPPNALRSGEGLVILEPDEQFSARWGISPSLF